MTAADPMVRRASRRSVVISVTSGKGGVGKSFVTANLAASLASAGRRVLVIDCDFGLANLDIMLGLNPPHTLKDVLFGEVDLKDVIYPVAGGFDMIPASSGVREMAQLYYEKIERLKEIVRSLTQYDYILLDTGAGIAETVLQFNLLADRNIIVVNRELTCLTDAYAMIKVMVQSFGKSRFDILVNTAADGKEGEKVFHHTNGIARRFLNIRLDYLGWVAKDDLAARSIMKRTVAVQAAPHSVLARNFKEMARTVASWD